MEYFTSFEEISNKYPINDIVDMQLTNCSRQINKGINMNKPYYCGECPNLYYDDKEHMFWCNIIDKEPDIRPWYQPEDCPYHSNEQLSFSDLINTMPDMENLK